MAEARKVYPMQTFASYMRDKEYTKDVKELLAFMTQKDMKEEFTPFAAALSKAWIYEQHPDLTKLAKGDFSQLGESVSVMPLATDAMAEADAVFDQLEEYKKTIAEQEAKIQELEGSLSDAQAKAADLESTCKGYEAQMKDEGEKKIMASEQKVDEYLGKVDELLAKIEDVKKHGVVTVAAGGGGAAPAAAAETSGGAPDASAGEDFGFSGGGDDPFASTDW